MKKETYIGLGLAALLIYLYYKDKKDRERKKTSGSSGEFSQSAPLLYYGIPLQYGGGGDVNQNVNVYQTQGATSTSTPIAQSTPMFAPTGGRGGGKGR